MAAPSYYDNSTNTLLNGTVADAEDVENKFDDVASSMETVAADMDNTLRFTNADFSDQTLSTNAASRASRVIGFDGSGNIALYPTDGSYIVVDQGAVAITGGTINGTTIGATTAAAGTFTSLNASSIATTSHINGGYDIYAGVGRSTETVTIEVGKNRTGSGYSLIDLIGDTTYTDYGLRIFRDPGANGTSGISHRGTGALKLDVKEAGYLLFNTSSTERMRITSDGKIGVNGVPDTVLTVFSQGAGSASDLIHLRDDTDTQDLVIRYDGTDAWQFRTEVGGAGNNPLTLKGATVGINTSAPTSALHVIGESTFSSHINGSGHIYADKGVSTGTGLVEIGGSRTDDGYSILDLVGDTTYTDYGLRLIRNAGANGGSALASRGTGALGINAVDNASILLQTNSTTRLLVAADGKVGIGTASPQKTLHLVGSLRVDDTTATSKSASANYLPINVNGTQYYVLLYS